MVVFLIKQASVQVQIDPRLSPSAARIGGECDCSLGPRMPEENEPLWNNAGSSEPWDHGRKHGGPGKSHGLVCHPRNPTWQCAHRGGIHGGRVHSL